MRYPLSFAAAVSIACVSAACGRTQDAVGPTDSPSAAASSVLKTLQVAPARVECTGVASQTCLQVRESADGPWTQLFGDIAGFTYEPGYLYEIRIQEESVANPPADASSVKRTLVSILSKTPVPPLVGTTWRLVSLDGHEALADVRVTAVFGEDSRVTGSAGCNRYFGRASVTGGARLDVGLLATTMMYCGGEGVMPQEQAFLAALEKAAAYRVEGPELRLGPTPEVVTLVLKAE